MVQHNAHQLVSLLTDTTLIRHTMFLVTVLVCTRNRSDQIATTIESILQSDYPNFELLIIDQSTNDQTEQAIAVYKNDQRLRYIRTDSKGLGLARAFGMSLSAGTLVLMTDDDCEVARNWISEMVAAHERYPQAAVVFCDVLPGPYDKQQGFIPNTIAAREMLITTLYDWCRAGAARAVLGAGMSVRRAVIEELGGFDTRLGAGTPLHCAEDTDIAVRALLHRHHVYRIKHAHVIHYGFRNFAEGRTLIRGYMFGIAAMYGKLLRCGHIQLVPVIMYEALRTLVVPMMVSLREFKMPPILGRAIALACGLHTAWKIALDRPHEVFEPISHSVIAPDQIPNTKSRISQPKL